MVLDQGISPVTFSVGNTMKRVAVVVSSVMFFRNPVSAMNWVSGGACLGGQEVCVPEAWWSSVLRRARARAVVLQVGSAIAIFGTYLYSLASDKWAAEQKARNAAAANKQQQ